MEILNGRRLGPYEIVSRIGAGGMGEVFRGRDTRLDRHVAIKVLPTEFASNAQLKLRFEREAKAISQLEHPHICRLYDVGDDDGCQYLVMELLEGETLADLTARGPLPLVDAVRFGAQIAEALDRAHRSGIVHRDLKPGNIMVTKGGAKLLDFGLAKVTQAALGTQQSELETAQKPLTAEGTIVGTFQYMAPEQLEGLEADARTDIFALGAVLYEMVTGRRAFEGKTRTSLIAAIMKDQPRAATDIQPLTPPALEHVIAKCLEKDPDARWQSGHDIAEELRWIGETGSKAGVVAPLVVKRKSSERLAWMLCALLLIALAVTASRQWLGRTVEPRLVRLSIPLPAGTDTYRLDGGGFALSPDGSRVVMALRSGGSGRQLWIRSLESREAKAIPETNGAAYPFWSPDSKFIAFFARGQIKKVAADGGPVQVICDAPSGRGGSWNTEGTIIFAPDVKSPIAKVSSAGGTPVPVTRLDPKGELTHRWPFFLPDGRSFLYVRSRGSIESRSGEIVAGSIDSAGTKVVVANASNAVYVRSGWLLFERDETLFALRFDPKKLAISGEPVALPFGKVGAYPEKQLAYFTAADDGTIIYLPPNRPLAELSWIARDGRSESTGERGYFVGGSISPDAQRIAFTRSDDGNSDHADIWIRDLSLGTNSRLTFDGGHRQVRWSGDGKRLFYTKAKGDAGNVYSRPLKSGATEELIYASPNSKERLDVSPDGAHVIVAEQRPGTNEDLMLISVAEKKASVFVATPALDYHPAFSPDGKWLAYVSGSQVYLRRFPDTGEQWQISAAGGQDPKWARDGGSIFFTASDGSVMMVDLRFDDSVQAGTARPLFRTDFTAMPDGLASPLLGVSADSQRFLVVTKVDPKSDPQFEVVLNWQKLITR